MVLKRIYVAHPMRAETKEGMQANRANAALWVAWVFNLGYAPVCSWITITGHIEDSQDNRARGLECDKREVETCDEVWLVGGRISSGMKIEAEHAWTRIRDIPVRDFTYLGRTPPPLDWALSPKLWRPCTK